MRRWSTDTKFWVGLCSSAIFLALALQQVEWKRTVTTLLDADWVLACLGVGALIATFVTFAFRWRVLLSSAAEVSVKSTFSYIMIGYLANTVLPLRLGEGARALLLGRQQGIKASLVFGSVVLERTLDVLTILVLAVGLSFLMDIPPLVRAGILSFGAVGLVALLALIILSRAGNRAPIWAAVVPRFLPRNQVERLAVIVANFSDGLKVLHDGGKLSLALVLSGLAWTIAGTSTIAYIAAFHLHAPWYAGFFVLTVTNLGSAIPSSPGFIGVYHYLAVLALSVWVPDKSTALGYAIGTHGISLLVNVLLGSICLARQGIAFRSIGTVKQIVQEPVLSLKKGYE